jgi:hypothetical protein
MDSFGGLAIFVQAGSHRAGASGGTDAKRIRICRDGNRIGLAPWNHGKSESRNCDPMLSPWSRMFDPKPLYALRELRGKAGGAIGYLASGYSRAFSHGDIHIGIVTARVPRGGGNAGLARHIHHDHSTYVEKVTIDNAIPTSNMLGGAEHHRAGTSTVKIAGKEHFRDHITDN